MHVKVTTQVDHPTQPYTTASFLLYEAVSVGIEHAPCTCAHVTLLLTSHLTAHTYFSVTLQINKFDWLVFNAAWLGVMFAGVEIGLAIAIGLSVVIVLYKTGFPHMAVIGRLPGTTVYRYV